MPYLVKQRPAMSGIALHDCVCTGCGGAATRSQAAAVSAWECNGVYTGCGRTA
ncbi:hypothetical protein S245_028919, partial [Arachis hypogaea]